MKKRVLAMILFLAFSLCGCNMNQTNNNEEMELGGEEMKLGGEETELYGFDELQKAPTAMGEYELEEIIKIQYFDRDGTESKSEVEINIGERNLSFSISLNDSYIMMFEQDYTMTEEDISEILEVLDKYEVMDWSELYGEIEIIPNDPGVVMSEGPSYWSLALQFSDGTVKWATGYYNGEDEFPDDLEEFVQELEELIASKKPEEPQWEEVEGSSYVIENYVGEQVRISLHSGIEEGYTLATKVEDGEEQFAIMKDGELCSRGFFTGRENGVNLIENYETNELYKNYDVYEVSNEEYPRYIYLSAVGSLSRTTYYILYDETSAGVVLVNQISEESARDIFERVTFERVEE